MLGQRELEQGFPAVLEAAGAGIKLLIDLPLQDLARLFLDAKLVVANDCGPGNLAQMAGAPCVMVFGNWDGDADQRIAWWFNRRAGAQCLTTRDARPIGAIGEDAVADAARQLLDNPRFDGAVRYVDR